MASDMFGRSKSATTTSGDCIPSRRVMSACTGGDAVAVIARIVGRPSSAIASTSRRAGPVGADVDPVGDHADASGVDVDPVAVAALDDLRVTRDDPDARTLRRLAETLRDGTHLGDLDSLLEDEAGGQVERRGTAHGQVVDRAVDGQVADAA